MMNGKDYQGLEKTFLFVAAFIEQSTVHDRKDQSRRCIRTTVRLCWCVGRHRSGHINHGITR